MDFSFTSEQQELRRAVRDLSSRSGGTAPARACAGGAPPFDAALWRLAAEQLGLTGLAVAEDHGGAGATWVELGVALEELGRDLLPIPLLSSAVAAATIERCDAAAAADLLPPVASGSCVAALALAEGGLWDAAATRGDSSSGAAGDWRLTGRKEHVLDGAVAGLFVVSALAGDGPALFAVDAGAEGLTVTAVPTLDVTRGQAVVELDGVPARLLGDPVRGSEDLAAAIDLTCVALAAESVGAARRSLEITVDYLKTREQFGRPIGSFQALKHRAADLVAALESAASAAYYAMWAAAHAPDELSLVAPLAKVTCTRAFSLIAGEMIQLHGGIGFTWEHDAHLYFKRAKANELLFGDQVALRRAVAARAGLW